MKRCVLSLVLLLALMASEGVVESAIVTPQQKLEDFQWLYQTVAENYPYLAVKERITGDNWLKQKDEFMQLVQESKTDYAFYQSLQYIVSRLENSHANIVRPSAVVQQGIVTDSLWASIFSQEVVAMNARWQEIVTSNQQHPSFYARYIAGEYWVVAVDESIQEHLPLGVQLVAIDGMDVHEYVQRRQHSQVIQLDRLRDRLYTFNLPLPNEEKIIVRFRHDGVERTSQIQSWVSESKPSMATDQPNFKGIILEDNRVAYLRVRSFGYDHLVADSEPVLDFLRSVHHYPYVIMDIRGNGGGTIDYWSQLLMGPLILEPMAYNYYTTIRSGNYGQRFLQARLGLGYHLLQVERYVVDNRVGAASELLSEMFINPIKLPVIVSPTHSIGFTGKVFLLVDDRVYSSAEAFASFAKATNWATLVGTRTGGDGIGLDPIYFCLPHSKLVVRIPQMLGLNPDGTINEEYQTKPDLYVEPDPSEYVAYLKALDQGVLDSKAPHLPYDRILRSTLELIEKNEVSLSVSSRQAYSLTAMVMDFIVDMSAPPWQQIRGKHDFNQYAMYDGIEIAGVDIYGAYRTDLQVVDAVIGVKAGQPFSADQLWLLEKRLNLLGSHRSIVVEPRLMDDDSLRLVIMMQEGHPIILNNQMFANRIISHLLAGCISISYHNIGGALANIHGKFGFGPSKQRILSFDGAANMGFPVKNQISVGTQVDKTAVSWGTHSGSTYQVNQSFVSFDSTTYLTPYSTVQAGIRYGNDEVNHVFSATSLGLESQSNRDLYLRFKGYRPPHNPLRTNSLWSGQIVVGMLNSHGYLAGQTEFSLGISSFIAMSLRGAGGIQAKETPFQYQFKLGGPTTFAAYPPGIVGTKYVVAGAELRHYLKGDISLFVSIDGGEVWESDQVVKFFDPLMSMGVGLRYLSPFGPVEVKYAWNKRHDTNRLSMGLSNAF